MRDRTPWIVISTDGIEKEGEFGHCERCGVGLELQRHLPMELYLATAMMKAFVGVHSECKSSPEGSTTVRST